MLGEPHFMGAHEMGHCPLARALVPALDFAGHSLPFSPKVKPLA